MFGASPGSPGGGRHERAMSFRDKLDDARRARMDDERAKQKREAEHLAEYHRLTPIVEQRLRMLGQYTQGRTLGVLPRYRLVRDEGSTWVLTSKNEDYDGTPTIVVRLSRKYSGERFFFTVDGTDTDDVSTEALEALLARYA
jgi:hypothetical protein